MGGLPDGETGAESREAARSLWYSVQDELQAENRSGTAIYVGNIGKKSRFCNGCQSAGSVLPSGGPDRHSLSGNAQMMQFLQLFPAIFISGVQLDRASIVLNGKLVLVVGHQGLAIAIVDVE